MITLLEYFKRQKHVKIQEKYVLTKILVYLCILRHCGVGVCVWGGDAIGDAMS